MKWSDVRARIMTDHAELGGLLRCAAQHAWRLLDGDAAAVSALCAAVLAIDEPLRRHLDVEEELLGQLLHECEGWGPVHALDMRVVHAYQRDYLSGMCLRAGDPVGDHRRLARDVAAFVQEMVKEMEREEHELLHSEPQPHPPRASLEHLD